MAKDWWPCEPWSAVPSGQASCHVISGDSSQRIRATGRQAVISQRYQMSTVSIPATNPPRPRTRLRQPVLVDLFAGCGGLSLGLEQAGFRPIFVNELDHHAMESYLTNRRGEHPELDRRRAFDIFEITSDEAVLEGLRTDLRREFGDIDLVVGGPPCQGYSGIGHRRTFRPHESRNPVESPLSGDGQSRSSPETAHVPV